MQTVSVAEFKANFSSILKELEESHEEFVIEYGRSHKKVAKLVPYRGEKGEKRSFGVLKGRGTYSLGSDFRISDEELTDG